MDGSEVAGTVTPPVMERPLGFDPEAWTDQATADWLAAHRGYLTGFEVQWVAMVGLWIVTHAPRFGDAADLAQAKGIERPLMVPVPPAGDLVYCG
jgi:hypothetical protein